MSMSDDAIFQRRDDDDENDVYFSSFSIVHATTKRVFVWKFIIRKIGSNWDQGIVSFTFSGGTIKSQFRDTVRANPICAKCHTPFHAIIITCYQEVSRNQLEFKINK